jgi:hypothetical protein
MTAAGPMSAEPHACFRGKLADAMGYSLPPASSYVRLADYSLHHRPQAAGNALMDPDYLVYSLTPMGTQEDRSDCASPARIRPGPVGYRWCL